MDVWLGITGTCQLEFCYELVARGIHPEGEHDKIQVLG